MPVRAVLLAAEALNLKLELRNVDLTKRETLKPEFIKVNKSHNLFLFYHIYIFSYVIDESSTHNSSSRR